jgi:hypothetical protein
MFSLSHFPAFFACLNKIPVETDLFQNSALAPSGDLLLGIPLERTPQ